MLKNLIKQPLLHFLLIGLGLFLLYNYTERGNSEHIDSKIVVVDREGLLNFMQYRSKAFDRNKFKDRLNNMSEEELKTLIDDYVREEVLYREAKRLGLDRNDYVIRKRLIQKLEFINQGFVDSASEIKEQDIINFFEKNKEDYFLEPCVTFTHVFFDKEKHGNNKAEELAKAQLIKLNRNKIPFTKSTKYGDRFLYQTNYVERTPDYIESHFGNELAEMIFQAEPSDKLWQGPYESPYGYHLIMLTSHKKGRYPELSEIYDRVKEDTLYDYKRHNNEAIIKEIINSYEIQIVYNKNEEDENANEMSSSKEVLDNKSTGQNFDHAKPDKEN